MKNSVKEVIDRLAQKRGAREKARKDKEFWEDWGFLPEGWNANPPESEDEMKETDELTANISHWIKIAGQVESLKEETNKTWESWVARPCIKTMLAPRQARAALEVIGHLANYGYSIEKILYALVNIPRFKAIFYQTVPQAPSQSKPPGSDPVASATESI